MTLSYYIVDDEQQAVDALQAMLQKKFGPQLVSLGSHIKASLAIKEIAAVNPDLVFLDVEMPEMNGLDLLKHFPQRKFQVIFTTAHEKYALPALKAAATDYLVKPISPKDVSDALQKCFEYKKQQAAAENPADNKIAVMSGQQLLLLSPADIIRVEGNNNYSHFYFTNRPRLIVSKTLKDFEELLQPHGFYRLHQSHLVNLQYISSVKIGEDIVLMEQGHQVEISRRKKAAFMQLLKKL